MPVRSIRLSRAKRAFTCLVAATLAAFTTLVLVEREAPPASAAPLTELVTRSANGAVDFSSWSQITYVGSHQTLASVAFTRNGINYQISLRMPPSQGQPLVANTVIDQTNGGTAHSYVYQQGGGQSSWHYWSAPGVARAKISPSASRFYSKSWSGGTAVAQELEVTFAGADFLVSEIVYITPEGAISQALTYTNVGAASAVDFDFSAFLDTQLDSDDFVPILRAGPGAVYIDSGIHLYMALTDGDMVQVGNQPSGEFLDDFRDVDGPYVAGEEILNGVDTCVDFELRNRTIPADESVTMGFEVRLYGATELDEAKAHVALIDDEAGGALVAPLPGATVEFTGAALSPINWTEAQALAAVPPNYLVQSVEGPTLFDDINAIDQPIAVHLRHAHQIGQMTTTRTVTYTGADPANPTTVVQTQDWITDLDLVTNTTAYTAAAGYSAVVSPAIAGYTPDIAQVAATGPAVAVPTMPTDTTVTVTYVPVLAITGDAASVWPYATTSALCLGLGLMLLRRSYRVKRSLL